MRVETGQKEIQKKQKKIETLRRWYGQYLESKHELVGASREYSMSTDWNAAVRVCCFTSEIDQSKNICEDTKDRAACHYLAGCLEQSFSNLGGGKTRITKRQWQWG